VELGNSFYKKSTIILLVLWIITIGVLAKFFIEGFIRPSTDNRQEVVLQPTERDLVLGEMRTLLQSLNGILIGLSENDFEMIETSARSAGMAMAADVNPALMGKLPLDFKNMGMGVHKEFDTLADLVKGKKDSQLVIKKIGEITQSCVACHAVYRLSLEK
jgi:hypothetical protein